MKKNIGIILCIIGILLCFLPIKALLSIPSYEKNLKSAVTVEDGKIHPENEGKLVLISGKLKAAEQLRDPLTGVKLPGMVADRHVWYFKDDNENWRWAARNATYTKEDNYGINAPTMISTKLMVPTTLGEFKIAYELLMPVSALTDFKDYNESDLLPEWHIGSGGRESKYCVSRSSYLPSSGTKSRYADYDSTEKINYSVIDPDNSLDYTIVGIQKGDTLTMSEDLQHITYEGILTLDELTKTVLGEAKAGSILGLVFGILFLAGGFRMTISGGGRRGQQQQ